MRRMRRMLAVAGLAAAVGCGPKTQVVNEVVALRTGKLPGGPGDKSWAPAPEYTAKLLLQDLVDPRLTKPSTQEVRVRALTDGSQLAVRLSWTDPEVNDVPGPGRFLDGCAIQIPRRIEPNPPDPQMGQAGKMVEIVFWRADWQASVNGRRDAIQSLYPNAAVDHYPFDAKPLEQDPAARKEMAMRYAPAAASGNRRAGPPKFPVEDLVAEGPGTLAPHPEAGSRGGGERTADGWSVMFVRKAPAGWGPGTRTQIAFAVWEGSAKEAGGRKMRSGWAPLSLREALP